MGGPQNLALPQPQKHPAKSFACGAGLFSFSSLALKNLAVTRASAWRTKRRGRNTEAGERYQCTAFWGNHRLWQGS